MWGSSFRAQTIATARIIASRRFRSPVELRGSLQERLPERRPVGERIRTPARIGHLLDRPVPWRHDRDVAGVDAERRVVVEELETVAVHAIRDLHPRRVDTV